jgi:hypothetical protein
MIDTYAVLRDLSLGKNVTSAPDRTTRAAYQPASICAADRPASNCAAYRPASTSPYEKFLVSKIKTHFETNQKKLDLIDIFAFMHET